MNAMWDKAVQAARSARTLQADGDHDGAINRAYSVTNWEVKS